MLRVAHFLKKIEAGIDEAGRGPLFGRVYAAAVILNPELEYDTKLIKDSKKLSKKKNFRERTICKRNSDRLVGCL